MEASNKITEYIKIIVIDDNQDWCDIIKMMSKVLTISVAETITVNGAEDAIRKINEENSIGKPFNVAIVDMQLDAKNAGDQSGVDIISYIKENHPYMASIIATGKSLTPKDVLGLRDDHGLDDYLAKDGISPADLTKSIIKGLNRISSRQNFKSSVSSETTNAKARLTPKVFISYSHRDEEFKDELISYLRGFQHQGVIDVWQDREIRPGDEWSQSIQTAMDECQIALLLVSVDFLNSEFILGKELPTLFQHRKSQGLRAIPIIVRECLWQEEPVLKDLQALPKDGKPVKSFSKETGEREKVWTDIVKAIERVAKS